MVALPWLERTTREHVAVRMPAGDRFRSITTGWLAG